ncbi:MAG: hydrogenase maturation protease [Streptosporangiaceae bacterium]
MLVIGIGNAYRGDDAAGLAVADRVRVAAPPGVEVLRYEGEPVSLIDRWDRARSVYLVDAVSSGGEPGSIYRFDATGLPLGAPFSRRGTHAFGVAETIELARALGRLPLQLIGYGIEGRSFGPGAGLSPEARRAVSIASARLLKEVMAGVIRPAGPPGSGHPVRDGRAQWDDVTLSTGPMVRSLPQGRNNGPGG